MVEPVAVPSLTVMVMVELPLSPVTGVIVTVRLEPLPPKTILASGTKVVLLEAPVTIKSATALSESFTVKAIAPVGVFSGVEWSFIVEIVGASLAEFTVNTKLTDVLTDPSFTVIVIVDVPL